MSSNQIQSDINVDDETYLKIWQIEQEHQRTRWTLVTFFISISFAILGFSFQSTLSQQDSLALRLSGLLIYWFAYILLLQLYAYTKFLRAYLMEMENSDRTTIDIQSKLASAKIGSSNRFSTVKLILYFGVLYTIGIAVLWLFGL